MALVEQQIWEGALQIVFSIEQHVVKGPRIDRLKLVSFFEELVITCLEYRIGLFDIDDGMSIGPYLIKSHTQLNPTLI